MATFLCLGDDMAAQRSLERDDGGVAPKRRQWREGNRRRLSVATRQPRYQSPIMQRVRTVAWGLRQWAGVRCARPATVKDQNPRTDGSLGSMAMGRETQDGLKLDRGYPG